MLYASPQYTSVSAGFDARLILASGMNVNIKAKLAKPSRWFGWPRLVQIVVPTGALIGSTSSLRPALTTDRGWAPGSQIHLVNSGKIIGAGGDGARVLDGYQFRYIVAVDEHVRIYHYTSTVNAQKGGDAIQANVAMNITNHGVIAGGGGGGGSTLAFVHEDYESRNADVVWVNGAGGGGQGHVGGLGPTQVYHNKGSEDLGRASKVAPNRGGMSFRYAPHTPGSGKTHVTPDMMRGGAHVSITLENRSRNENRKELGNKPWKSGGSGGYLGQAGDDFIGPVWYGPHLGSPTGRRGGASGKAITHSAELTFINTDRGSIYGPIQSPTSN